MKHTKLFDYFFKSAILQSGAQGKCQKLSSNKAQLIVTIIKNN